MSRRGLALTIAGLALLVGIWAAVLGALPDSAPDAPTPPTTGQPSIPTHAFDWYGDCAAWVESQGRDPRQECTPG